MPDLRADRSLRQPDPGPRRSACEPAPSWSSSNRWLPTSSVLRPAVGATICLSNSQQQALPLYFADRMRQVLEEELAALGESVSELDQVARVGRVGNKSRAPGGEPVESSRSPEVEVIGSPPSRQEIGRSQRDKPVRQGQVRPLQRAPGRGGHGAGFGGRSNSPPPVSGPKLRRVRAGEGTRRSPERTERTTVRPTLDRRGVEARSMTSCTACSPVAAMFPG